MSQLQAGPAATLGQWQTRSTVNYENAVFHELYSLLNAFYFTILAE
jgi:hypothetical protein